MEYNADFWIEKRRERWLKNKNIEEDRQLRELLAKEIIENLNLREEIIENPEKLIEMEFVIVDKKKNTVPFFLNDVQKDFIMNLNTKKMEYMRGKLVSLLFLVLKGRQQGFTSLITAYQLACAITNRNFEGFTLADVMSNAQTIFENKAKMPFNSLPNCLKPLEKFNNKKEFKFENINSAWEVAVASDNVGRSRTINFFHGSECAFWKGMMSNTHAALRPALTQDCIIIYETTANGFNDFKDMWDSGEYINCFYEWWKTAEYNFYFESEEAREKIEDLIKNGTSWIAKRLKWLSDKGLESGQIYWYYKKYKELGEKVKQEYPCTPEEAFLMSGSPVFDVEKINNRISYLREKYKEKPYRQGYFTYEWEDVETENRIVDSTIRFVESDEKAWIKIYKEPEKGVPYVIGGDTKGEGSDWYTGQCIDNITQDRVATLKLQVMISKPYTHQMYCLGKYFNTALLSIEINFNTAPIEELQRLGYEKQYVRRKYDDYTKRLEPKYGWKTDGRTRPVIIDTYAELIQDNIEAINDIDTLKEALTFVYDDKGRPDAIAGKHDDLIMADMIAEATREQQAFRPIKDIRKTKYTDDMWLDYQSATEEERKIMNEMWGNPC